MNLRYAFQDDENCFFVLDLMLGGDLRFHLDRAGAMAEEVVRFYVAEIAMAIDYLHSKRIVHRDLKPDNILLDERGHAHITDFNIAVHFSERRLLTGVAGSMAYMAPEVLTKRGYSAPVDYWSLGILAYELLFAKRPFRGKTNSALTNSILHEPLSWPEDAPTRCSSEGMHALRSFLERDPNKRLGYRPGGGGFEDIKAHPWFAGLDWAALGRKQVVPPFEPDSKRANFDATHELEELLLEENPLKARKRKNDGEGAELSPEMRMMEDHFAVFDYTRSQRRSYYRPPQGKLPAAERIEMKHLSPDSARPHTPSDHPSHVVSGTGDHIEDQIMEGGGLQGVGSRDPGRQLDSPRPSPAPTPSLSPINGGPGSPDGERAPAPGAGSRF